jgi:hypothetical protein
MNVMPWLFWEGKCAAIATAEPVARARNEGTVQTLPAYLGIPGPKAAKSLVSCLCVLPALQDSGQALSRTPIDNYLSPELLL